jgi:hypothetical protein
MHIAAEGALPKELLQRVQLLEVLAAKPLQLEYDAFAEIHLTNIFYIKIAPSKGAIYILMKITSRMRQREFRG